MNIQEFQDKLKEIQTLAMKNGKQVQAELVQQFFGEEGMDQEKLKKVFDFLEMILRIVESGKLHILATSGILIDFCCIISSKIL